MLVVRATSPAFNAVLAIAGAVVTAEGGPLSHAAVLARELGIPAVVGAWRWTSRTVRQSSWTRLAQYAPSPSDSRRTQIYVRCDGNDVGDGREVIRYDFYDPPTVVAVGWAESRGQTNAVGVVRALRPDGTPLPWHG